MKSSPIIFFTLLLHFNSYSQDFDDLPIYKNGQIIHHTYYSLEYAEAFEQAAWVAYRLDKSELLGPFERQDNFRIDDSVSTGSATLNDYVGSGYDRGHLIPAEDVTFSELSMSESFFLSNMSPQSGGLNRGQWRSLENAVREWAYHFDSLFVITGPVLTHFIDTIGTDNQIPVPKYYYKAIYAFTNTDSHSIAFILPNEKVESYKNYVVTVDSLENLSGLNFFPNTVSDSVESKTDADFWFYILDITKLPSKQAHEIENVTESNQCNGITSKGSRCRLSTNNANGYCHLHQP